MEFLNRFIGHQKRQTSNKTDEPLSHDQLSSIPEHSQGHLEPPQLVAGCAQSVGRQREHNEDALLMLTTTLASNQTNIPSGLYIVADGMGGHLYGEKASEVAVRTLAGHILHKLYAPLLNPSPDFPNDTIQEILYAGTQDAHRMIGKEAPGGGTTLTAAFILGEQLTIAHVGDSRAYLISEDGTWQTLTRDHSVVRRMEEMGQLTAAEAAVHPQRNLLYRALGQGEPFDPDITTTHLPPSGYLLICSDGLWGVVPEKELKQLITLTGQPHQVCQDLVTAANAAGGPDNISVILVRLAGKAAEPNASEQNPE